jgi:autotransporter-associated beta strand protein
MKTKNGMNRGMIGLVMGVLLVGSATADTTTFTNNNANWSVAANWDNGLPGVGKSGIIGGGGSPITARMNADISGPPDAIFIRANGTLILWGTSMTTQHNLVMEGGKLTTDANRSCPAANTIALRYDSLFDNAGNQFFMNSVITNYGAEAGRLIVTNSGGGGFTYLATAANMNTYSGGTLVCNGTLQISTDNCLGSGDTVLLPGATLNLNGGNSSQRSRLVATDATINWGANLTLTCTNAVSRNLYVSTTAVAAGFYGLIADGSGSTGRLVKTGTGTLTLYSPTNTYSGGTLVTQGVLGVAVEQALGNGPVTVANGAEVQVYNVNNATLPGWTIEVLSNATVRLMGDATHYTTNVIVRAGGIIRPRDTANYSAYDNVRIEGRVYLKCGATSINTWFGTFRDGAVPGTLIYSDPGVTPPAIRGAGLYTGGTELQNSSTVQLSIGGNMPDTGRILVHTNCVMDFNSINDTVGGLAGVGWVKLGSAVVTNAEGIAPGTNLFTTGTLTATGTTGRIVLGANSTNLFHLIAPGTADQMVLRGNVNLTLGGALKIDKVGSGGIQDGDYTLFDLDGGTPTNSFAKLIMPDGYTGIITTNGNDIVLTTRWHAAGTLILIQ